MEMCFMLRAKRRMVCGVVLALAMSGQVVAASPPAPIIDAMMTMFRLSMIT